MVGEVARLADLPRRAYDPVDQELTAGCRPDGVLGANDQQVGAVPHEEGDAAWMPTRPGIAGVRARAKPRAPNAKQCLHVHGEYEGEAEARTTQMAILTLRGDTSASS